MGFEHLFDVFLVLESSIDYHHEIEDSSNENHHVYGFVPIDIRMGEDVVPLDGLW